jgi:hypothetical protein
MEMRPDGLQVADLPDVKLVNLFKNNPELEQARGLK